MSHLPFIKISVVLRESLHPLKGAPALAFLALVLNEAEMSLGQSHGLSAHDVAAQTGYGLRATRYALEYLGEHGYATKLEARGDRDESLFRVSAYAWFCNPPPPSARGRPPTPASSRGVAQECAPVGKCRGLHSGAPVVVVNSRSIPNSGEGEQQQAHPSASRAIFAAARVAGPPLELLARTVDADLAREWTERLKDAPESFRDPVGYLIARLSRDPTEKPPPAWQKRRSGKLIDDEFAKYVHGRPEHTQYCREHPDEVDCECGR